ncbi:MAG: response regulator transcription factor [Candidatus Izemoplasmatales bacterium]|jgi:two-component system alkaline phosphatase synthesis response regulator PhoP
MRPLIYSIEDETNIQNVIKIALENANYDVGCFLEAAEMFEQLKKQVPDLFLVDIMLPGINGLEIIKHLKNNTQYKEIPIMVISAKGSEIDKVIGLDLGADDYLAKPFGILELISRVKALLRRRGNEQASAVKSIGEIEFRPKERQIVLKGQKALLTEKEYLILELLASNQGKTVSREEIIESIWGYDFIGESRTIDVHIKKIREKLTQIGQYPDPIQTIRGIGYKINL